MSALVYARDAGVTVEEYIDVVGNSTLGATRPLADPDRVAAMLSGADLIVTARIDGRCVGLARCLTDFAWVAYCGDLAVHGDFQGRGIGRELLRHCREELGDGVGIALLSVPEAVGFYERSAHEVGFRAYPHAFFMNRTRGT
ncbi:MAG TPA: GNAT family N-acetyltransferase [Devosiaceae bacterium]|jgi:ribosomal protein S18 acetylase RimI-like enzyme|nr:GNAT family N-acetyltransferase [Devosiaceae bacterium]